ncbi:hypothetical protein [Paraburkholderia tropica]|uniref:hypothetical protein n=1 Tax=Paraburkholderia tropica TaxID=92647 RepID=UPI002AB084B4|nr:hypothetical protein [Paraburkholderia tropica]
MPVNAEHCCALKLAGISLVSKILLPTRAHGIFNSLAEDICALLESYDQNQHDAQPNGYFRAVQYLVLRAAGTTNPIDGNFPFHNNDNLNLPTGENIFLVHREFDAFATLSMSNGRHLSLPLGAGISQVAVSRRRDQQPLDCDIFHLQSYGYQNILENNCLPNILDFRALHLLPH